jgi:beta-galactosidase
MKRTAGELKKIGPKLVNLKKKSKVAILYSIDSFQSTRINRYHDKNDYKTVLNQLYQALYKLNVGVDFVFSQNPDFNDYDVLIVPPLYITSDDLLEKLASFAERGGHLLAFKSGFCDEYSRVRWTRLPGPLRKACGFYYQEFSNLKEEIPLKDDPFKVGKEYNKVSIFAEMIIPETATALAYYDHHFFGRYPAITRNKYGKGTVVYEGTVLSDKLQEKVMLEVLKSAALTSPDQELPAAVKVRHGIDNAGKNLHYYFNYSGENQVFGYPYRTGIDLLTNKKIEAGQSVALAAWNLVIIEEQ